MQTHTSANSPLSLITGIGGFVGNHLAKHLLESGERVHGIDIMPDCKVEGVGYSRIDITDPRALGELLRALRPANVYHLAAVSYLPQADATPRRAISTNILGTVSLLDAVKVSCPAARLLIVGSSKEYGFHAGHSKLTEETAADPSDFYAISKFSAEMVARQYVHQFGLDIRFTRSFNHTGPGQSPKFVCADWARQVAEIEHAGASPELSIGTIDFEIDFADVRDVVRAYRLLLRHGRKGEVYNVCTGQTTPLKEILEYLCARSSRPITISHSASKVRSHRASPRLAGDPGKLKEQTGWKPEIPLTKTLDDLYAFWSQVVKAKHRRTG
jgi:GDP-4-dehydro-6-deoxy-D-mannose reductase